MHSNTPNASENKLAENEGTGQSQNGQTSKKSTLVSDLKNGGDKFGKATL